MEARARERPARRGKHRGCDRIIFTKRFCHIQTVRSHGTSRAALNRMAFVSIGICLDAQNLPGSLPGHAVSLWLARVARSTSCDVTCTSRRVAPREREREGGDGGARRRRTREGAIGRSVVDRAGVRTCRRPAMTRRERGTMKG